MAIVDVSRRSLMVARVYEQGKWLQMGGINFY